MTDATSEFFEGLRQRSHEPLLQKAKGTLRIELTGGKRVERWLLSVDDGKIDVSRRNAAADCTVRADRSVFNRIVRGEVNAFAAFLRGAIALGGNPSVLLLFQRLFPGPPKPRRRSAARGASKSR